MLTKQKKIFTLLLCGRIHLESNENGKINADRIEAGIAYCNELNFKQEFSLD